MHFVFVTLFPEFIQAATSYSILGRAQGAGLLAVSCVNPRDFATDKHRSVDDTPCGGGVGMVLRPDPFLKALAKARELAPSALVVALTPAGELFTQQKAQSLSTSQRDLIFLCGHYEGFDERILDEADLRLSVGDYVLTGGEMPALMVMDAVSRLVPGVLGRAESAEDESYTGNLLEYPQYTRPVEYEGARVPAVLLSGDHKAIAQWRRKESLRATATYRPDLLAKAHLNSEDGKLYWQIQQEERDNG